MRINTLIDYFMVVALVFVSGNLAFQNKIYLFIVFLLATVLFFYRKIKFDMSFVYFLIILMIILILQAFKFDFFPISTILGVYIRILIAYFVLKAVVNFPDKFVKVMYYISLISFVFFLLIVLVPGFSELLISKFTLFAKLAKGTAQARYSIMGIYTIVPGHEFRNGGPFWEMGAFGGYLMLALLVSYLKNQDLKNKMNIVFIIAIFSTQSSTAFIVLVILLTFIFNREVKDVLLKIILAFSIFTIGYIAYTNLYFLGEKIEEKFEVATELAKLPNLEGASTGRFITMIKDWRDFQGHELIGRGSHNSTRFTSMYDIVEVAPVRTVGSTDLIVRFGLPFFFLVLFYMYKSFSLYSRHHWANGEYMGASILVVILVLLTSETYFLHPLIWITLMLHYTINDNRTEVKKVKNKVSTREDKFYNLND